MAACLGGHARNDDHEAGHQDTRGLQHRPAPGEGHTVHCVQYTIQILRATTGYPELQHRPAPGGGGSYSTLCTLYRSLGPPGYPGTSAPSCTRGGGGSYSTGNLGQSRGQYRNRVADPLCIGSE